MKKFAFMLVPLLMLVCLMSVVPTILSSGFNPTTIMLIGFIAVLGVLVFRPSKKPTRSAEEVAGEFLMGFGADAFSGDDALRNKYYSALEDFGRNMPKAAIAKLEKLAPLCTGDKEKYAVAMASAKVYFQLQKYTDTIREYNKALVLHPSCELSTRIGECYHRQGNMEKAIEAYEFATELDPQSADAWSRLATAYVAEWDWDSALEYANQALQIDSTWASALATCAISYGVRDDVLLHSHYTRLAVENGFSEEKIKETVKTLKKRGAK